MRVAYDVNKKLSQGAKMKPVRFLKYTHCATTFSKKCIYTQLDGHAVVLLD